MSVVRRWSFSFAFGWYCTTVIISDIDSDSLSLRMKWKIPVVMAVMAVMTMRGQGLQFPETFALGSAANEASLLYSTEGQLLSVPFLEGNLVNYMILFLFLYSSTVWWCWQRRYRPYSGEIDIRNVILLTLRFYFVKLRGCTSCIGF